ncbi:Zn-ribbon domain-containing protein [Candidatus Woesearchaeota archaeon]|nr:Zn-ribbon domain-containing protein [Candidatus Woesearchaeota archaeon]
MPHQCVRCNTFYDDGANELLKGCTCGSKLFFYVRNKKKVEQATAKLSDDDKKQIEQDVKDLVGIQEDDQPVILDLESVNVKKPGKYEIDLVNIFKGEPLIYKVEDGKYVIDIASSFQLSRKLKEKENQ